MTSQTAFYRITVGLLLIATCLPYFWNRIVDYKLSSMIGDFGSAAVWLTALLIILIHFSEYKGVRRWWPILTAPIALFPAVTTIVTFVIWKLRGFAP
jgi:hypothetical protein